MKIEIVVRVDTQNNDPKSLGYIWQKKIKIHWDISFRIRDIL